MDPFFLMVVSLFAADPSPTSKSTLVTAYVTSGFLQVLSLPFASRGNGAIAG